MRASFPADQGYPASLATQVPLHRPVSGLPAATAWDRTGRSDRRRLAARWGYASSPSWETAPMGLESGPWRAVGHRRGARDVVARAPGSHRDDGVDPGTRDPVPPHHEHDDPHPFRSRGHLGRGRVRRGTDEIITAVVATASYLRNHHPDARVFVLSDGEGSGDLQGVELVEEPGDADVIAIGGACDDFSVRHREPRLPATERVVPLGGHAPQHVLEDGGRTRTRRRRLYRRLGSSDRHDGGHLRQACDRPTSRRRWNRWGCPRTRRSWSETTSRTTSSVPRRLA